MKTLISIILFFITTVSFGQKYLNDTVSFNAPYIHFSSAFETDSGIYLSGMRLTNSDPFYSELLLGFVDTNGVFSNILSNHEPFNDQRVFGGIQDLILNDRNNFVYFYLNCDTNRCAQRIKEITPQGTIVTDIRLDSLLSEYGIVNSFDYNDMIFLEDSTYGLSLNCQGGASYGSNLFVRLSSNFNVIDTIYFEPLDTINWSISFANIAEDVNGDIILAMNHYKIAPPSFIPTRHLILVRISGNNEIIDQKNVFDIPFLGSVLGLQATNQGFIFTALSDSYQDGNSFMYSYYLYHLDKNFNVLWKSKIRKERVPDIGPYWAQQETIIAPDGNYIVAGAFLHPDTLAFPNWLSCAQLSKFSKEGELLWQRFNHPLPYDSIYLNPGVEIQDVINTADSGFCMVGQYSDISQVSQDPNKFKGYVLKVNCLGFLGEALAGSNHMVLDGFDIQFVSTSTQDGGVTWHFGDGESFFSDEYTDTIMHSYPTFGPYEVTMIAHGCHDENDTLTFLVSPKLHADPSLVTNGNGYFSIFPNPSQAGEQVYVYLNALNPMDGNVQLDLFSISGQLVQSIPLTAMEGTYPINAALSSGIYLAALSQGGNMIEQQKIAFE